MTSANSNKIFIIDLKKSTVFVKNLRLDVKLSEIKSKPFGTFFDAVPHVINDSFYITEKVVLKKGSTLKYNYKIHKYNLEGDYIKAYIPPSTMFLKKSAIGVIPYGLDEIDKDIFVVFEVIFYSKEDFGCRIMKYNLSEDRK